MTSRGSGGGETYVDQEADVFPNLPLFSDNDDGLSTTGGSSTGGGGGGELSRESS